jgi:LDH2 family malate/lactate/ureidoglycolate dehydrogenase
MLAAEYFGRLLSGSDSFYQPPRGGAIFGHSGVTMVLLRADLFQPMDSYRLRAQQFEARIRAVPPAPGFKEVLMPGDLEQRTRLIRQRDGIPILNRIWNKLTDLASSLGVKEF